MFYHPVEIYGSTNVTKPPNKYSVFPPFIRYWKAIPGNGVVLLGYSGYFRRPVSLDTAAFRVPFFCVSEKIN